MSDDVKAKLEKRKKEIEEEFHSIQEKISETSKTQSELQGRLVQLRGAYQEIQSLLVEPTEKPKKK